MAKVKKSQILSFIGACLAVPAVIVVPTVLVLKSKDEPKQPTPPTPPNPDETNNDKKPDSEVVPTPDIQPSPQPEVEPQPTEDSNQIRIEVLNLLNQKFEERLNIIIDVINTLSTQKDKNEETKHKIELEKQKLQRDIDNLKAFTNQDDSSFTLITDQLQHQITSYQNLVDKHNQEV
ncbi:hypothetical protein JIY74_30205 [Vibrio harveyi]|nr:hypothetical protein [Vibrio harveyi]